MIALARVLLIHLSRRRILQISRLVGDLAFFLSRRHRMYATANIEVIFGTGLSKKRQRAIIRKHFRNTARVLLDLFWFSHDGRARLDRWSGIAPGLRSWLNAHPGAIIVTGHIGNWEVAGQTVVAHGYPLTSVAKHIGTAGTTQRLNRIRRRLGQKVVMADGAVRGLIRALQAGDFVALLLDQHVDPTQGGVWIDFFGLPAAVSSMPARLSQRFKVPVGICIAQSLPDGRYCCHLLGVCETVDSDDPTSMTQAIMNVLATCIRRQPSQWLLAYKRWKRWPPGADSSQYPAYARPWTP